MALGHLRGDVVAPLYCGDNPAWGWFSHVFLITDKDDDDQLPSAASPSFCGTKSQPSDSISN